MGPGAQEFPQKAYGYTDWDVASLSTATGDDGFSEAFAAVGYAPRADLRRPLQMSQQQAGGRDLFDAIDKSHHGVINKQEFFQAFADGAVVAPDGKSLHERMTGLQLDTIYGMMDRQGKGYVTKKDFRQFRREMVMAREKEFSSANGQSAGCYQM